MGEAVHTGVICTSCGSSINVSMDRPDWREPCPCGSFARTHQILASDTIGVKVNLYLSSKIKERILGVVKRITVAGDSFWRDAGIWVKRIYIVDKNKKWYTETVTDSDGNIIHHCSEPLPNHHNKKSNS